jgi:hypothetical protein
MGYLNVTAEFLDGRPNLEVKMAADYPVGKEPEACFKMLASINMMGGIIDILSDGVSLLPLNSIKKLTVQCPAVHGASMADLANLTSPVPRS